MKLKSDDPATIYKAETMHDPYAHWEALLRRFSRKDQRRLEGTLCLAGRVHYGQTRRAADGDKAVPYIVHPMRVARILTEEWGQTDLRPVLAALLHDVVEDCPPTLREVIEFEIDRVEGREILDAVGALTKPQLPEPCPADARANRDARYFKMLFQAPDWVRLVKCADRVDNLRDARNWGNRMFWTRYSSETLGWHLYLARETSPIAEVALFKALVEGERELRGHTPIWLDGKIMDPAAAALVSPEIARRFNMVGLALRNETLFVGISEDPNDYTRSTIRGLLGAGESSSRRVEFVLVSPDAIEDALEGFYTKA